MKVVLNKCYGGFGLSPKAIKRFLELSGCECYFYKQTKYKHNGGTDEYVSISVEEAENEMGVVHVYKKDLGQKFSKWPDKQADYFGTWNLDRSDPLLVQTVEELGAEASARLSELHIVEIPDNIQWDIDDYDGIETIHEKHRSW